MPKTRYLLLFSYSLLLILAKGAIAANQEGLTFHPSQLTQSKAVFTIYNDANPVGSASIDIIKENGLVKVIEYTDAPAVGVVETLICTMDPVSGKIKSYQGNGKSGEREIDIDLIWSGNQVSGTHDLFQDKSSLELPNNHFEQLCLFYSAHALPLNDDYAVTVELFNALDGSVTPRTVSVTGSTTLDIAGVVVDAYKVLVGGAKINQILSITKATPRKLVKIEFDVLPFRYELVTEAE